MLNKAAEWLASTSAWRWFAEKYVGHITFRMMGYPKFPMEDFFEIVNSMSKSKHSIFCFASSDHDSLASMMIRRMTRTGKMSHGGIITPGGVRGSRILHMKGKGPVDQHLLDILREVDYFAVIEVKLSPENYKIASNRINYIKNHKEKFEYDYEQKMNNEKFKLYCSEMIYVILEGLVDDPDFKARKLFGRRVFDPDQVLHIGDVVYTNHPDLANVVGNKT